MHTEKEAQRLYCPNGIFADAPRDTQLCRTYSCMAWRWAPDSVHESAPIKEAIAPVMPPPNPDGFWVKGTEYSRDMDVAMFNWGLFPHRGYCGLAGKPDA